MNYFKKNLSGNGYITTCIIVIVAFMFLFFAFQYLRVWTFTSDIQKKVSSAVIQVSQDNYTNIFASSREGYTGAYELDSETWNVNIDSGDVYEELQTSLGASKIEKSLVKKSGENIEYILSNINVTATCSRFQSAGNPMEKFEAETSFSLFIPIKFFGEDVEPLKLNLKCKSNYSAKFFADNL